MGGGPGAFLGETLMARWLITGGCGFVGTNATSILADAGHDVGLLDNLSRPGSRKNLDWIRSEFGNEVRFSLGDVRDSDAVSQTVRSFWPDVILHLAAQVAVTTSLEDPRHDFDVNAMGTLNVLEAARKRTTPPAVLVASTNKVYGSLARRTCVDLDGKWQMIDRPNGIAEYEPLDPCTPYGVSKATADRLAADWSRSFGVPTVVFRMSCIYGEHQWGTEDQGWVAHFAWLAERGEKGTIYGDGRQVRDVLWVSDLIDLYMRAAECIDGIDGDVFNVGGGPDNILTPGMAADRLGFEVDHQQARIGDQLCYISDVRKAKRRLGWKPTVTAEEGLSRLRAWVTDVLTPAR